MSLNPLKDNLRTKTFTDTGGKDPRDSSTLNGTAKDPIGKEKNTAPEHTVSEKVTGPFGGMNKRE